MVGMDVEQENGMDMTTLENDSDVDVVGLSSDENIQVDHISSNRKFNKVTVRGSLKFDLTVMCCSPCVIIKLFVLSQFLLLLFRL